MNPTDSTKLEAGMPTGGPQPPGTFEKANEKFDQWLKSLPKGPSLADELKQAGLLPADWKAQGTDNPTK